MIPSVSLASRVQGLRMSPEEAWLVCCTAHQRSSTALIASGIICAGNVTLPDVSAASSNLFVFVLHEVRTTAELRFTIPHSHLLHHEEVTAD